MPFRTTIKEHGAHLKCFRMTETTALYNNLEEKNKMGEVIDRVTEFLSEAPLSRAGDSMCLIVLFRVL